MRTEKKTIEIQCDICKDPIVDEPSVSNRHPTLVTGLKIEHFYGQTLKHLDICYNCSDKIIRAIR